MHETGIDEATFREILEHLPVGVFVADALGGAVWYNANVLSETDSSYETLHGWRWLDRVHPDDRAELERSWRRATATGTTWRLEYRSMRTAGYTWIQGEAVAIQGGDGAVRCWVGTLTDVTDRKAAEQRLAATEARFRTAFLDAPMGIAVTSLAEGSVGRYLEVNDALCRFLGRSRDQLLASTFTMVSHPDESDTDRALLASILRGEKLTYQRSKRYLRGDGATVWGRVSVAAISADGGRPDRAIVTVEDITETVAAREEAARTESLYRTAVESAPIGIAVFDLDSRLLDVNASFCRLVGRSRAELLGGLTGLGITPPEDQDGIRSALGRMLRTESAPPQTEYRCLLPDGTHRWMRVTVSLLRDAEGRVRKYLVHCEDMQEERRARAAAAAAEQRLRSAFWSSPTGAAILSLDPLGIIDVNPAMSHLLGRPRDELLAKGTLDLILPAEPAAAAGVRSALTGGGMPPACWERSFLRPDGSERWGRVAVTVWGEGDTRAARALVRVEDTTGARAAAAGAAEEARLFRLAFESAPTGLTVTDMRPGSEGRFLRVNDAFCDMLGYTREHLLTLGVPDVTHPEDQHADYVDLPGLIDGSLPAYGRRKRYVRADGSVMSVEVHAAMLRDGAGRPWLSIGHIRPLPGAGVTPEDGR